jgi:hypothetical protein
LSITSRKTYGLNEDWMKKKEWVTRLQSCEWSSTVQLRTYWWSEKRWWGLGLRNLTTKLLLPLPFFTTLVTCPLLSLNVSLCHVTKYIHTIYKFWCFLSDDCSDCGLLGCDTVWYYFREIPTSQTNMFTPSSGLKCVYS